jgi:hypothetical protein
MSRSKLTKHLVLREFDDPIDDAEIDAIRDRIESAIEDVLRSGTELEWEQTDVLTDREGAVVGLMDEFKLDGADADRVLAEHADAAELPLTAHWQVGDRFEGEPVDHRESR